MKKKTIISILIIIGLITITLIVLGIIFDKEEFEKQQGRTSIYDVSSNGTIAYVFFDEGNPGIYLQSDTASPEEPIVQLKIDQEILDISFSPDGKKLAYIISHKNKQEDLKSAIHVVNVETGSNQVLFAKRTLVTEIEYHPTNEDMLYYLNADTFENYSPIASAKPHDFDVFSYQISSGETKQHTDLKKYMMQSLRVSRTKNTVYVSMFDDTDVETAEDSFATYLRIFEISLDDPKSIQVVSQKDNEQDIYDFAVAANDDAFIYQAVNDTGEDGIFQYELFFYDRQTEQGERFTHLREHTTNPIIGPDEKYVYFVVDKQFGSPKPDYYLYQMTIGGGNPEEIPLYMN
ncbi:PD40 domain-containing protein [Oceanobacillus halophilus]|nr:PD40 domain-containing protein [Oceanobacillus halophilus]